MICTDSSLVSIRGWLLAHRAGFAREIAAISRCGPVPISTFWVLCRAVKQAKCGYFYIFLFTRRLVNVY